jgi:hypothetical protein
MADSIRGGRRTLTLASWPRTRAEDTQDAPRQLTRSGTVTSDGLDLHHIVAQCGPFEPIGRPTITVGRPR